MKFKCPKCKGKKFVRDQKSIRCMNLKCIYHLKREEKQLYLSAKRKHKKHTNSDKLNKQRDSRIKSYYISEGIKKGSLTLKQAARLKGTTTSTLYNHLPQLNVQRKPLRIIYDSKLIKLKIFKRKECLR